MKKGYFAILIFSPVLLQAQSSWWRIYCDSVSIGYSVVETSDGNYAVASYEHANPGILKLDCRGEKIWFQQQYMTQINFIKETTDKGYIVSGFQGVSSDQIVAIKTDSLGQMKWKYDYQRTGVFGGGYCVIESWDGGYVVAGSVLLKLDTAGQLIWLREYDGIGHYVSQTSDGGYIVCGQQESKLWLLKTDYRGKIEWERIFGIVNCTGYAVHQTTDGGYLIGASGVSSISGTWEVLFLKASFQGDSLWTRVYDDKGQDYLSSLEPTLDGNYIASGYTTSFGAGSNDAWFMKIGQQANLKWKRYWAGSGDDCVNYASQTSDGGYIITGYTTSFGAKDKDLLLIKTDAYGNLPIEISPTAILSPWKNYPLVVVKPKARFINKSSSRYNQDVYYHCSIVGFDNHDGDKHDSVLVEGGHDAWKAVEIEFPEWTAKHPSAYKATFWATGTAGYDFPSEPMSVTFYKKSDIEETPQSGNSFEIIKPVGNEIVFKYSGCTQGFCAEIFDASGRKVDQVHSNLNSGALSWGQGMQNGIYFIKPISGNSDKIYKAIIVR